MSHPPVPSLAHTTAHPAYRPAPPATTSSRRRVESVDLLRGLVMIIMMLDHTRDILSADAYHFDPADVTRTSGALFLTRWITHFCAPAFVFLAGTSVWLQQSRGKTPSELSGFLIKRGLWLIVLELTVIKFAMWYNVNPTHYLATLQVIWVIGVSMIVLAAFVRLPTWASAAVGISMITLHNLTDGFHVAGWDISKPEIVPSAGAKLWMLLHQQGQFPVLGWPSPVVFAMYPLVPWIGVMLAGYAFGRVFEMTPERRRRVLLQLGAACIAAFLALRIGNLYGDPAPWSRQPRLAMTIASFFNATKYPPSLAYLLMTLGPGLLALAAFERWSGESRARSILLTFGRVPLFYYVLQWVLTRAMAVTFTFVSGKPVDYLFMNPPDTFIHAPPDAGFSLATVWIAWIGGVALLYPVCRWYAGVKARRDDWWISYI